MPSTMMSKFWKFAKIKLNYVRCQSATGIEMGIGMAIAMGIEIERHA